MDRECMYCFKCRIHTRFVAVLETQRPPPHDEYGYAHLMCTNCQGIEIYVVDWKTGNRRTASHP